MSETKRFTIYGASDDLVETKGIPGCDEFYVNPNGEDSGFAGSFVLSGPGGVMRIHAFYGRLGVWFFAPAQMDEGVPLPDWPLRITHDLRGGRIGYSTRVEIDVPDGTVLVQEPSHA